MSFREQIEEVISANGWEGKFRLETLEAGVRVLLADPHPSEPSGVVNDYLDGVHSLEQVQQECLRSLRTGRPGI